MTDAVIWDCLMNPLFLRLIYFKRCIDLRNFAIRHTFEIKYGKFNRELIFTRYFCGVVYPTTISVCLETIHRCPSITFYLFLFAFTAPDFNLVLSSAMIWTTYFMATEFFRNWFTVDFSSFATRWENPVCQVNSPVHSTENRSKKLIAFLVAALDGHAFMIWCFSKVWGLIFLAKSCTMFFLCTLS